MSVSKLDSYLAAHVQCLETAPKNNGGKKVRPFVTISRQSGAGGVTVGNLLVEIFNRDLADAECQWTLFDKNLVQTVIEQHDLPERLAKHMPEARVNQIQDILESFFGVHPSTYSLVHKTSKTILNLAEVGHAILVGRGAQVVTRRLEGGFHVRLIGSLKKRVAHAAAYYNLTEEQAEAEIKKEEKGKADYLKSHFHAAVDDPSLYDLIINTDRVTYREAAEMIAKGVIEKARRQE